MKTKNIIVSLLIVGVIAAMAAFGWRDNEGKNSGDAPVSQLTDKNGQPVAFDSFKGKVVFVNNWASWCPPCRAEMPSIQELKNKLGDSEVVFVMVTFDEDTEKAHTFIRKQGLDFEVYFPGINYPYPTSSIPATFILDKQGNVVAAYEGMKDYSSDEMVEQLAGLAK